MINSNLNHILTTLQLNLIKLTLSQRNLIEFRLKHAIKIYGVRHKFNLLIQSNINNHGNGFLKLPFSKINRKQTSRE